jgi:hypothetical protein
MFADHTFDAGRYALPATSAYAVVSFTNATAFGIHPEIAALSAAVTEVNHFHLGVFDPANRFAGFALASVNHSDHVFILGPVFLSVNTAESYTTKWIN